MSTVQLNPQSAGKVSNPAFQLDKSVHGYFAQFNSHSQGPIQVTPKKGFITNSQLLALA